MTYNVTKDFKFGETEYKEGDVFEQTEDMNLDAIVPLVEDGTLAPIVNEEDFEEVVVDQAWLDAHPDAAENGIELGDTVKQPKEVEETEEEKTAREAAEEEATAKAEADAAPKLYFNGKLVITDTTREVEGRTYHHVRLEDGTATDVLDHEYDAMVKASTK